MTLANVSSAYLASALLPAVRQTQTQLSTLEVESSSGQYANLGLQLGDQTGYELSLRAQDDLMQTLTTANGITGTNLSTSQTALTSILSSAQAASKSLVAWSSGGSSSSVLQSIGESQLQQLISVANTTSSGGYLFGGQNTGAAPLDDYFASPTSSAKSAIDSAFQSYFGFSVSSPQVSAITASQMQGFLAGPYAAEFQSPSWGANWSTASDDNMSSQIAPGDTIETSTNANTAGFKQLAQGYTMLSEFAGIGLGSGAEQALASAATTLVTQGSSSIADAQSSLGVAQSQITQANSQMSSQMTLLQTQLGKLDNVDPAKVATELSTLTTQLQAAYQLTAQINSMSLAQYLPT